MAFNLSQQVHISLTLMTERTPSYVLLKVDVLLDNPKHSTVIIDFEINNHPNRKKNQQQWN